MQLKSARSLSTSSVAMNTHMSTHQLRSHWTIPRCFSPMPAWTRYAVHMCLFSRLVLLNISTVLHHTVRVSSKMIQIVFKVANFLLVPVPLSSSQFSSTLLIHPTLWPSYVALPTLKSVYVQEANTMTWMTWVKMSTITPSSRCWGPGRSGITLRYCHFQFHLQNVSGSRC